jgi:type II secretory pathway pseudopilin PulG
LNDSISRDSPRRPEQRGFTYIGLLIFVAILSIGLALIGQVWHTAMKREKETELLFIGDEFRTAIANFYEGSPGGVKKFPMSLEELLEDRRFPVPKRHLRKIYHDPMTGEARWGLVEFPAGGIMGVYSLSELRPLKIAGFRMRDQAFADGTSYADWKFGYDTAATAETDSTSAPVPAAGLPGAEAPEAPSALPVPTPVPTVPSKDDPDRQRICDGIFRTDKARCSLVRFKNGTDAGARCDASAFARNAACLSAVPLPPLVVAVGNQP